MHTRIAGSQHSHWNHALWRPSQVYNTSHVKRHRST